MRAIDADRLLDRCKFYHLPNGDIAVPIIDVQHAPTIEIEPNWIPVTERLPKEEDSIFARYYGTDRWRKSMFRKKSREVIVTSVFEDGELHTEVAHTTDGEWHVGVNVVPRTVIAWMPIPEPWKGEVTT